MQIRVMAVVLLTLPIIGAGETRAQERVITTTGIGVQEFDADWARVSIQIRLRGKYNDRLLEALYQRADSLATRMEAAMPESFTWRLHMARKWFGPELERVRNRHHCVGAEIVAEAFVMGIGTHEKLTEIIGDYSECVLAQAESGLSDDSTAVRIVRELAVRDAVAQAVHVAELAGVTLGQLQSLNLNSLEKTSERSEFERLMYRGLTGSGQHRFKSVRRAVAVASYAIQ